MVCESGGGCVCGGGGLWRAGIVPALDHIQQVIDVRDAVVVDVVVTGIGYSVHERQVIGINITIAVEVTLIDAVGDVVMADM